MLVFSLLKGSTLRIAGANKDIVVFPKDKAGDDDLVLLAAPQENPSNAIISWPGEYDVAGITVRGIGHDEGQRVSYMVEADAIRMAFPNSPLHDWTEEEVAALGDVHVLVLRGDEDTKKAQKLLDEVDPRLLVLIPGEGDKFSDELVKLCGAAGKEHVDEHKVKGTFGAEGREVVVLG
jgi:hypothetical protein